MTVKKLKFAALGLFILLFGAAFIIYPERYVKCCLEGFALWAQCVLPSLFPFIVLALLFIKSGLADKASLPLRRLTNAVNLPPNAAVCFLISICSGYPAGSRTVAEFYGAGALDSEDCKKLAPLCSTSGPLFIVGSVGFGMFSDKTAGLKIFLAHVLAVTVFGLIFSKSGKPCKGKYMPKTLSRGNLLYDCFYGAVVSVAVAGGFISFFYVVAQFFADFNILYPVRIALTPLLGESGAEAFAAGLMEVTTGCKFLAECDAPLKVPAAGFLITFGGVSIIMQQLCYLVKAGVKPAVFILCKFAQAALCFFILIIIP